MKDSNENKDNLIPNEQQDITDVAEQAAEKEKIEISEYVCDCPSCSTKIYFEKEDLSENDTLNCPHCLNEIEINTSMLDKFKNESENGEEKPANYVVDCPSCNAIVYFEQEDLDENGKLICPACSDEITVETDILDAYRVVDDAKRMKKKKKVLKILSAVGGFVVGAAVIVGILFAVGVNSVVKCGKVNVSKAMYDCAYYYGVLSNESSVSYYSYYGFDAAKKPSEQKFTAQTEAKYETWGDYFEDMTKDSLATYIAMSNKAEQEGYKLEESDKQTIKSKIDSYKTSAQNADQSFKAYMKENFGCAISEKTLNSYIEMVTVCQNYYSDNFDAIVVSDDEIENEYKQNPNDYDYVDFYYGYIEINDKNSEKTALAQAKDICSSKNADEFTKKAEKYSATTSEINGLENNYSVSTLKNYIDKKTVDFLADKNTAVNDTFYIKSSQSSSNDFVEFVMLSKKRYRDTSKGEDGTVAWKSTVKQSLTAKKMSEEIEKIKEGYPLKSGIGMLLCNY